MPSLPRWLPNVKAVIIGCADMRVDPSHVLGIRPGEAVVMRNIGGRITPGLLEQLGLLGRIGQVAGEIPGGGGEFHMIVLQHTDCRITRVRQQGWVAREAIFRFRKGNSRPRRSPIRAWRWLSTLLRSGRSRHCQASGLFPASFMTSRPDLLRSSYLQRQFVPLKYADDRGCVRARLALTKVLEPQRSSLVANRAMRSSRSHWFVFQTDSPPLGSWPF
jgi:Carbonic anhydrase